MSRGPGRVRSPREAPADAYAKDAMGNRLATLNRPAIPCSCLPHMDELGLIAPSPVLLVH